jgi:hypothetical protein
VCLAQNHHQPTRKNRLSVGQTFSIFPCAFDLSAHFRPFIRRKFPAHSTVNLQKRCTAISFWSGLSSDQWECCSTFRSHSHPSVQKRLCLTLRESSSVDREQAYTPGFRSGSPSTWISSVTWESRKVRQSPGSPLFDHIKWAHP